MSAAWNEKQDKFVAQQYHSGYSWKEITFRLNTKFGINRSLASVAQRAVILTKEKKIKIRPPGEGKTSGEAMAYFKGTSAKPKKPVKPTKSVKSVITTKSFLVEFVKLIKDEARMREVLDFARLACNEGYTLPSLVETIERVA